MKKNILLFILFLSSSIYSNDKYLLKAAYKGSLIGVKSAIEKCANINATTRNGITPLMYASQEGIL